MKQKNADSSSEGTIDDTAMVTLQSEHPEVFEELVLAFENLVERCFEERLYRVSQRVSAELGELAGRMGSMQAGPRDVVEVYGTCLKRKLLDRSRSKTAIYSDIGQVLALELMGYLVSYYRDLARRSGSMGSEGGAGAQ